jgi:DNA-dependent RNA polymerase auxiliary subunit epsilon
MRIKVTSDTLFKLAPRMSSELTNAEKVLVKNGTEFEIEFYTEVAGNHLKLELAKPPSAIPLRFLGTSISPMCKSLDHR